MPSAREMHTSHIWYKDEKPYLLIIGGRALTESGEANDVAFNDEIHMYDIEAEEWTEFGKTTTPMGSHCSALFQSTGQLFVYGGTNGARFFDSILKMDLESKEWLMLSSYDGHLTGD